MMSDVDYSIASDDEFYEDFSGWEITNEDLEEMLIDAGAKVINEEMKVAAARTLAEIVIEPVPERILPDPLDKTVGVRIGEAVAAAARKSGVCR
jgi:hypothetical protein